MRILEDVEIKARAQLEAEWVGVREMERQLREFLAHRDELIRAASALESDLLDVLCELMPREVAEQQPSIAATRAAITKATGGAS